MAAWTQDNDKYLAQQLAEGTSVEDIADFLDRSVKAVRNRARRMLPENDDSVPQGSAFIGWLRVRIQHGYDWQDALRQVHPTPNAGNPWDWQECEQLVGEVRAGLTWKQIAQEHGRTVGAIEAQAALLVTTPEERTSRRVRADLLRELVASDPHYNWASPLRENHSTSFVFSPRDDEALRVGWQEQTPLAELAAGLNLSEVLIARRLVQLGIGNGLIEITDSLGCTPGGFVDQKRRLALDPANIQVLVLIASDDQGVQYVSVHLDPADADAQAQQLTQQGLTHQIHTKTFI